MSTKRYKHIDIMDTPAFIMFSEKEFNEIYPGKYTKEQYDEAKKILGEDLDKLFKEQFGEDLINRLDKEIIECQNNQI